MLRTVWLCVLICCHYNHGSHGSMQEVKIFTETTSYTNYTASCQQRPDPGRSDLLDSMKKLMSDSNVRATWLPIWKKDFGQWEWLTGEFFQKFITSPEWFQPGLDCAVLRSQDKLIDDVPCVSNYSNYMCQAQGQCDPKITANSAKCVNHNNGSYYVYKEEGNWFDARDRCTKRSQSLAVLTSSERQVILDRIHSILSNQPTNIWLGLRQKDYYLQLSAIENRSLNEHHWNRTALCKCPEKNCVVLERTQGGQVSWKQEDCSVSHPYFCMKTIDQATSPSNGTAAAASPWWWFDEYFLLIVIGAACVGGTLLIIILTGICYCCCMRKSASSRREKKHRRKEEDYQVLEAVEVKSPPATSTPNKSEPPKPAPRGKPLRPSLENLDKVGLPDEDEKIHLMNNTDNELHAKQSVMYSKGDNNRARSAPEGECTDENVQDRKGPVRPQYTEEQLHDFRRQAQKKMPPEYFEWIMWSLADAVVKIRSLEKRAELFDLLNVPRNVCSFTVGDKSATAEDIFPILQHWYAGKKPQKAWKDLQKIIDKEYTLLQPWLGELESSSGISIV